MCLLVNILMCFYWAYTQKGLPQWLSSEVSTSNAGDAGDSGSIPRLGRSPGDGNGNPLQYSCLKNPRNRGASWFTVQRVSASDATERMSTQLTWLPTWLPRWLSRKEFICNAGDLGLIPGLGRSSGDGNGNPLQYSCLENSMDRGVHGVPRVRHDLVTKSPLN